MPRIRCAEPLRVPSGDFGRVASQLREAGAREGYSARALIGRLTFACTGFPHLVSHRLYLIQGEEETPRTLSGVAESEVRCRCTVGRNIIPFVAFLGPHHLTCFRGHNRHPPGRAPEGSRSRVQHLLRHRARAVIFVVTIYLQGFRIDIPVKSTSSVASVPCQALLHLLMLESTLSILPSCYPSNFLVRILDVWEPTEHSMQFAGIAYSAQISSWLLPPSTATGKSACGCLSLPPSLF
ncbi:hypothetical protein C8R44DRAFT_97174 [Mycena epipterygia]|nr:hypothetical protein C8R44DRAFT_97174 [Mycena epipterygia]